jgi:hypothetical protein
MPKKKESKAQPKKSTKAKSESKPDTFKKRFWTLVEDVQGIIDEFHQDCGSCETCAPLREALEKATAKAA